MRLLLALATLSILGCESHQARIAVNGNSPVYDTNLEREIDSEKNVLCYRFSGHQGISCVRDRDPVAK